MTDKFDFPMGRFNNPDDITARMVFQEARYWSDALSLALRLPTRAQRKAAEEEQRLKDASTSQEQSEDSKSEDDAKEIPFSQILSKPQKPNLFGNSRVSFKILSNPMAENEKSRKRARPDDDAEPEESCSKKSK
uniref:Uncharacterized protein n=2 Tax=Caenorhabditis tropicalis TaxID=1561998 RepID=A0A1I7TRT4_9PELO